MKCPVEFSWVPWGDNSVPLIIIWHFYQVTLWPNWPVHMKFNPNPIIIKDSKTWGNDCLLGTPAPSSH